MKTTFAPNTTGEADPLLKTSKKGRGLRASYFVPDNFDPRVGEHFAKSRQLVKSFSDGFVNFSRSQDALRLCIFSIVLYLLIGTIYFSFLLEQFTWIDSLYFAVVTFTTCGYGDLVPHDFGEKLFTIFFILGGVVVLGVALGIIGENLVALQEKAKKDSEKINDKLLMHKFDSTKELFKAELEEEEVVEPRTILGDAKDIITEMGPMILLIIGCSLFMGHVEGWDIITSLYYCVVTTTSVGYGDVTPQTQSMRLFAVVFIPVSVAVMAEFLGRVAGIYIERKAEEAENRFLSRQMTVEDFERMDVNHDGQVSFGEFISFIFVAMGKVDQDDIDQLRKLYNSLDKNHDGKLSKDDLVQMARKSMMFKPLSEEEIDNLY